MNYYFFSIDNNENVIIKYFVYILYVFSALLISYNFRNYLYLQYIPIFIISYLFLRWFNIKKDNYILFLSVFRNLIGAAVIIHIFVLKGALYVPAMIMFLFSIPMIRKYNFDVRRSLIIKSYVFYFSFLFILIVSSIVFTKRMYYIGNIYYELIYVSIYSVINLFAHVHYNILSEKDLPISIKSKLFNLVFDNSYQFTGLLDKDGTLLKVNKTALEFIGKKESDVIGKDFKETPWWSHSLDNQRKITNAVKLASTGNVVRERVTHLSHSGEIHNVLFSLSPVKSDNGNVEYLIAEGMDINLLTEKEKSLKAANKQLLGIQKELEKSRERYLRLLDNSPVIIYRWDLINKRYEYMSPALKTILGYSVDDFYNRNVDFKHILKQSDYQKFKDLEKLVLTENKTPDFELDIVDSFGNNHHFLHKSVMLKEDGEIKKIEGILTDISELQQIKEEKEEFDKRFRKMADNISEGVSIIESGNTVYTNKKLKEIFGLESVDIDTFDIFSFVDAEDLDWINKVQKKAGQNYREFDQLEFWIRRPDGERRYVSNRYTYLDESDYSGRYILTTDITERKVYEEKLRSLESAVENTADSIIITDLKMQILFVNRSFENTLGWKRSEIVGNNVSIIQSTQHRELYWYDIQQEVKLGHVWEGRIVNKTKEGHYVTMLTNISPIKNPDGKVTGFVLIKKDITEQILIEEQNTQVKKMEALGTLAGGLAHDFNNILGGIVGSAELIQLLAESGTLDEIGSYTETIKKSSERASDIIKQLLSLSRKEGSKYVTVDLNLALKHVSKMFKNNLPENVALNFNIDSNPANIIASPAQVEQIIHNLITNASHSMTIMKAYDEEKGGMIKVFIENSNNIKNFYKLYPSVDRDKSYYIINVEDQGVGIEKEIFDKIFEPFYTTKNVSSGSGLGLAIVYNLVKLHNGYIFIDSDIGVGSVFKVLLPAEEEGSLETKYHKVQNVVSGKGSILIVDDEIELLEITSTILKRAGYNVMSFSDPFKAIKFYEKNSSNISLAIIDMSMPQIEGNELCSRLLDINDNQKILRITGYDMSEKDLPGSCTKVEILNKPYNAHELTIRVKNILE